jgi:uncharacterized protein involved in response to NO
LAALSALVSADLPAWPAIAADLSFPVVLLTVVARELVVGRNWRNLPVTAPLAVFVVADLLMHLESLEVAVPAGLGWRLGLAAPILLISVIGGRIIPSFTRNWLSKRYHTRLPAPHAALDTIAVGLLCVGFALWAVLPDLAVAGAVLVIAAVLNAWRLSRWAGEATWREPLLWILHLGYAWVAIGTALLGLSILDARFPVSAAIHALTAGAIGAMILGVIPRVTLGHTGRDLTANRATVIVFVLINAAAISRVAASWNTADTAALLALSAGCWVAAFALFKIVYGPMLLTQPAVRSGSPK